MSPPVPLALESAEALALCMQDGTQDKALITQLIETRREGRKMPGLACLPPLCQVAARILDGDGTDDAARYWRHAGEAERSYQLDGPPAIPGTFVRDGYPGDINDPERFPEEG